VLILLIWIPEEADKGKQAAGTGKSCVIHSDVCVAAGGGAVGARNSTPEHTPAVWGPDKTRRWLHVKAGVIVIFEPRVQAQFHTVGANHDLILRKRAEQLCAAVLWREGDSQSRVRAIRAMAVAEPPDDVLSRDPCEMVLKINIEGVQSDVVGSVTASGPVEVDLQGSLRARRDDAIPSGQQIPAGVSVAQSQDSVRRWLQRNWSIGRLSRIPLIRFAFGGEGIFRGELRVGSESATNQAPVIVAVESAQRRKGTVMESLRTDAPRTQVASISPIQERLRPGAAAARAGDQIATGRVVGSSCCLLYTSRCV